LSKGYFFEYMARNLCGDDVGQTAPKTPAACRDAYGSVLFIDEAYSLYQNSAFGSNDYGQEAITALISEMENHRDDMVVIMAGYTDDMDHLMEANAGLRSRMPFIIEFPNYSRHQLFEIFMLMVKKHFTYTEDFESAVKEFFDNLSDEYLSSNEFANARFARNLYERTWSKAALRSSLSGGANICLKPEDLRLAASEKEFSEKLVTTRKIGF
ncbi:MAG: AAA family ATPase, partial [Spirochaetales bacterium]|nr:AAA family ATPase [Spirochaetales bacterium]